MNDPEVEELTKQILMLEKIAKQVMTKQAIQRYGNLKMAHQNIAVKAITVVAQAAQLGQIKEPLTDDEFKRLLLEIQKGKRTFNVRR